MVLLHLPSSEIPTTGFSGTYQKTLENLPKKNNNKKSARHSQTKKKNLIRLRMNEAPIRSLAAINTFFAWNSDFDSYTASDYSTAIAQ